MEIWKNIEGFENLYQVSNLGNVKCLKHTCPGKYGNLRTVKEHLMNPCINKKNGYVYVTLSNKDRGRTFAIHRLVAKAFVDNPEGLTIINHKDENKLNNSADNLEWCTSYYNNTYNDVHLKRKHYAHTYEFERNKIVCKFNELRMLISEFKTKYPDVDICDFDIKCNNHGKQ